MEKNGVINLYKPQGYTSHDCVAIVRRATGIKKVGHTGTLDPMAEGVLPICIGKATRAIEYYDGDFKTYECEMKLGLLTETLDIWGEAVKDDRTVCKKLVEDNIITREKIEKKLREFLGECMQKPPKYSALKVDGKRLYEYARQGLDVEIKARPVYIKSIRLIEFRKESMEVSFEIECSKGTYVRTVCQELGEKLGTCAAMSKLVRTRSGSFRQEDSMNMEELKSIKEDENSKEILSARLIKVQDTLENLGVMQVKKEKLRLFLNGVKMFSGDVKVLSEPRYKKEKALHKIPEFLKRAYRVYSMEDGSEIFLGVAFYDRESNTYKAEKILYTKQV